MSPAGSDVIQGFFSRGVAQLAARFGTSPGTARAGQPHPARPVSPIQRHTALNGSAFPLPENLANFTQVGGQPLPAFMSSRSTAEWSTRAAWTLGGRINPRSSSSPASRSG
jgi:hypothetical protein